MLAIETMTPQALYEKLKNIKVGNQVCQYSLKKCEELVPVINEINALKREKKAVILVHTYVTPEIIYGVGDFVGDSYGLSKNACETDAEIIVFSSVRFMGETAKILNPHKEVLIPSNDNGCDLADSISAQKVRDLREEFPDHTFVCYINTTADVKAECDVCVTSGNVYKIIENIENKKIYFLPDRLMAMNLIKEMKKRGIDKDISYYCGACSVHQKYQADDIFRVRSEYPDVKVVSHPECQPEVCNASDFVGSTAQMLDYMKTSTDHEFLMLTECGLSSRLQSEFPNKKLVGTCTLCSFMKSNTLEDILRVLKNPTEKDRVIIDEAIRIKAVKSIEAMFRYAQ